MRLRKLEAADAERRGDVERATKGSERHRGERGRYHTQRAQPQVPRRKGRGERVRRDDRAQHGLRSTNKQRGAEKADHARNKERVARAISRAVDVAGRKGLRHERHGDLGHKGANKEEGRKDLVGGALAGERQSVAHPTNIKSINGACQWHDCQVCH